MFIGGWLVVVTIGWIWNPWGSPLQIVSGDDLAFYQDMLM